MTNQTVTTTVNYDDAAIFGSNAGLTNLVIAGGL